ncbi:hypothetical protein RUM44_007119 [Polyplax serrata]|uniref:DNA topoisomerase (ATP-hydrolyzing) n=1 Tax=Polyplax serrata TaxID=468196 RepID=A0ABR1B1F8_POLSC
MNFDEAVDTLKVLLSSVYGKCKESVSMNADNKRWEVIKNIETLTKCVIKTVARNEMPYITSHSISTQMRLKGRQMKSIKFGCHKGCLRFVMILFLLSKVHRLLMTNKTSTKRELYYKNVQIFQSQQEVDRSVKYITQLLKTPSWELGIMATSKGLVYGPLSLHFKNGHTINCSIKGGVSIPPNIFDVIGLSSSAKWVLIIEKDATFQSLIDGETVSRLGSCIIITGKGYPDVSTRMLVCKIWEHLKIPILALNDADPYGFEIMCVYRFGSIAMSSQASHLACPAVRWLGVHPSDIKPLLLEAKALSVRDITRINSILKRNYVKENEQLRKEMEILLNGNIKAEIEGVTNISENYLTDIYLKSKIQCLDYF